MLQPVAGLGGELLARGRLRRVKACLALAYGASPPSAISERPWLVGATLGRGRSGPAGPRRSRSPMRQGSSSPSALHRLPCLADAPGASAGSRLMICLLAGPRSRPCWWARSPWPGPIRSRRPVWEEDWRASPAGLELVEARVQGSGAGMEPPAGGAAHPWHVVVAARLAASGRDRHAPLGSDGGLAGVHRRTMPRRWMLCAAGCRPVVMRTLRGLIGALGDRLDLVAEPPDHLIT